MIVPLTSGNLAVQASHTVLCLVGVTLKVYVVIFSRFLRKEFVRRFVRDNGIMSPVTKDRVQTSSTLITFAKKMVMLSARFKKAVEKYNQDLVDCGDRANVSYQPSLLCKPWSCADG